MQRRKISILICLLPLLSQGAYASEALTIYSSAQPGGVSSEQYRPGSGAVVPGYALIRVERDIALKAATHQTRVAYQTGGITWWADYNFTYTEAGATEANGKAGAGSIGKQGACKLDVAAWVSILNQSGAAYSEARLKLIAGDVQRAPQPRPPAPMELRAMAKSADAQAGFEEKAFFEYHLYTLGFPTTLPDNSTKQLALFPTAHAVGCQKALVYLGQAPGFRGYGAPLTERGFGVQGNTKVDVYLSFRNSPDNRMGMPLPAGRIRVSKLDTAGNSLEFIGEDVIRHTAKDESVLIKLGAAFDVVGERKQMDFRIDTNGKWMEEDIEIKLRNRKEEAVTVLVRENLYRWTNWSIIKKSQDFDKQDARTIQFPVRIAKGNEATLRYTVRYTW